jgi:CheY-like chemotaxis protein/HPt (histidine-containing phosphotransfer) domain-containing protein
VDDRAAGGDRAALDAAIGRATPGLPIVHILDIESGAADPAAIVVARPIRSSRLVEALLQAVGSSRPAQTEEVAFLDAPRETGRSLRILLAEDNITNQRVATRIVERLGHRLDIAANGAEAVEAVKRHAYDVVLMDVQMPEMDGFEATRLIRALSPAGANIPIIAMTASVLDGIIDRCYAAGMNDYIAKPFSVDNLRQRLIRWTSRAEVPISTQDDNPDADEAIDRAHLDELIEHLGADGVADLAAEYAAAAPGRIAQLQDAARGQDLVAFGAIAHSFASAAAALGLSELVAIARLVEHAALAGDEAAARRHVERVPAAAERAIAALTALVPQAA